MPRLVRLPQPLAPLPRVLTGKVNAIVIFGRFKGQTVRDVAAHEPDYLLWAANTVHVRSDPRLWRAVRTALIELLQQDEAAHDLV